MPSRNMGKNDANLAAAYALMYKHMNKCTSKFQKLSLKNFLVKHAMNTLYPSGSYLGSSVKFLCGSWASAEIVPKPTKS